ncbi:MAG: glucosamine-6-phosphate deaminase [Symbiobacteriaceae bacterium]|nr:glucosamine-6-phosphate deaminase [Symbiobacteriaceae bacterium]
MNLHIYENDTALARGAAGMVADALRSNPTLKLGLPTGSTPLGLYSQLIHLHHTEALSFAQASFFNLDEYVGLPRNHPQSFNTYMHRYLYNFVDANEERIYIPRGWAEDPAEATQEYATLLAQHQPLDLLVLGIGTNGHIGFCEPGTPWDKICCLVELLPETREANARHFAEESQEVPRLAITMGIAAMRQARQVMLLAMGSDKAEIIRQALQEPQTVDLPASALQFHTNFQVLLDQKAAALLQL